jgi:hypothetical protein
MKKSIVLLLLTATLQACIPNGVKDQLDKGMTEAGKIFGDMEFKKALGNIELHKLRTGHYPNSMRELKFLSSSDSTMFAAVEYIKLDSVYELNLKLQFPSMGGGKQKPISLKYPPEFWNGLGCVRSNVK